MVTGRSFGISSETGIERGKMRSWLDQAEPRLARCGGVKRAWLRMPEKTSLGELRAAIRATASIECPAVIDPQAAGAIIVRVDGVSWASAVADLTESQAHYGELADKLATRIDRTLTTWETRVV